MERINIEDARIRVVPKEFDREMIELLKATGEDYYEIVEFENIPKELQLPDRLPKEIIYLCNNFYLWENDEDFKEAFSTGLIITTTNY